MLRRDLKGVLDTVQLGTNPEIYHFRRGSHPGLKYYIKTIIPGPRIINDDTYVFWQFWETLATKYPRIVKLVDQAYDWHGDIILGWQTIWLEERIDISWSWSRTEGIDFHLIDYDIGIKNSGKKIIDSLDSDLDRLSPEDQLCFDQIKEITDFLQSYTTDRLAELNRKNFKVIEDEQIYDKTHN